jgi:hypothetical protein
MHLQIHQQMHSVIRMGITTLQCYDTQGMSPEPSTELIGFVRRL